jgi:short-chain fatty acids transporter
VRYPAPQLLVHLPLVLFRLWALAVTLPYHPPVVPPG